ncbi:MAG: transcriptional regulator NrdR [Clostridia bacterium]
MKCPFCQFSETRVIDSRTTDDQSSIRRRRECLNCGKRFTTYEKIYELPLIVIKDDGNRETFDRDKIKHGIIKACEKRPISLSEIEQMVNNIETKIRNSMQEEIPSSQIGEAVMEELFNQDEVAYVRFASVYRKFADLERFKEELDNLLQKKKE